MGASTMRNNVERWMIHEGLSFKEIKIHKTSLRC